MKLDEIKKAYQETKEKWGEWTAHNIELAEDFYTVGKKIRGDEFIVSRVNQIINDWRRKPLQDLRILDLACLEGIYSVELAKHGADVTGIEIRDANIEKAKLAKDALKLDKMHLFKDDVRNISIEKYGKFDVILCIGIMYHLDAPDVFKFIEKMSEMCTGLLIIDSHISLETRHLVQYKNEEYAGFFFKEHTEGLPQSEKDKSLWASIDNEKSFWFTPPSLYNFLDRCGFTSIYECHTPVNPRKWSDRVTLVAVKGQKLPYLTSTEFATTPPPRWTHENPVISAPHGPLRTSIEAVSPSAQPNSSLGRKIKNTIKKIIN